MINQNITIEKQELYTISFEIDKDTFNLFKHELKEVTVGNEGKYPTLDWIYYRIKDFY